MDEHRSGPLMPTRQLEDLQSRNDDAMFGEMKVFFSLHADKSGLMMMRVGLSLVITELLLLSISHYPESIFVFFFFWSFFLLFRYTARRRTVMSMRTLPDTRNIHGI